MAVEVLNHYSMLKYPPVPALVQAAHHDLESFLWVLVYAIYAHEISQAEEAFEKARGKQKPQAKANLTRLKNGFGSRFCSSIDPSVIVDIRLAMLGGRLPGLSKGPLLNLVKDFRNVVRKQTDLLKPIIPIIHDEVLGVFYRTIELHGRPASDLYS